MSGDSVGAVALGWWGGALRPPEDGGAARALRARLRRSRGVVDVLAEAAVIGLYDRLDRRISPQALAALAQVLAEVERHEARRLAQAFGTGDPKALSPLRFQRLIRVDASDALAQGLRRALPMVGHACNVASLASDLVHWSEPVRVRWCFDYYGARPPAGTVSDHVSGETE
ncbi:type I-E CRISPR-associated protein Cse2/CasB [Paracoccus homiensis]|uniref:CRISPR-associated protein, Cse2 family n=1 Tax=Paracoccus homiensis TaxID=364199 RepID=A0A1I0HLS5_9RHOB|nr:type I-E CRISPR-associated protein Cse2/CasB [Paracoccus homiensis]SET84963.1 CRISPR-associated protein, Cse2 family [Paracoccus homiensis]